MEQNKNYKRQYRELDDDVKARISAGLRHKSKTPTHRSNIAKSMTDYWKTVPSKDSDNSKLSPTETGQVV